MSQLPDDKRLQFVPQEERPPMSPQLALRVAMVGTFALAIFAILFFRLWFLQVLSSDHYAKAASVNFVRPVKVDGVKLTCEGTTIHVGGRVATAEGRVTDDQGRLVAHGTTTCMVFRPS